MIVPIWISFASPTHDTVTILTEGMKFNIGEYFSRNYNEVLNESADLIFHLMILLKKLDLNFTDVIDILYERNKKIKV